MQGTAGSWAQWGLGLKTGENAKLCAINEYLTLLF